MYSLLLNYWWCRRNRRLLPHLFPLKDQAEIYTGQTQPEDTHTHTLECCLKNRSRCKKVWTLKIYRHTHTVGVNRAGRLAPSCHCYSKLRHSTTHFPPNNYPPDCVCVCVCTQAAEVRRSSANKRKRTTALNSDTRSPFSSPDGSNTNRKWKRVLWFSFTQ